MNVICCPVHVSAAVISNRWTNRINDFAQHNWLCMDTCVRPNWRKIRARHHHNRRTQDERSKSRHNPEQFVTQFFYLFLLFFWSDFWAKNVTAKINETNKNSVNWCERAERHVDDDDDDGIHKSLWCVVILFQHSITIMCVVRVCGTSNWPR